MAWDWLEHDAHHMVLMSMVISVCCDRFGCAVHGLFRVFKVRGVYDIDLTIKTILSFFYN